MSSGQFRQSLLAKVDDRINAVAHRLPAGFPEDGATSIFERVCHQPKRLREQPAVSMTEGRRAMTWRQ